VADLRETIRAALVSVATAPLGDSARSLLATLGYKSERTIKLGGSRPKEFLEFLESLSVDRSFNKEKARFSEWKSVDLLFQLTDEEISGNRTLFSDTEVQTGLLRSYLFFAIELTGEGYARGALTSIARQINRVFPMPVMVLMKHRRGQEPVLSIAVINRRESKRDAAKDVLGKVSIIRDVFLGEPHRGHLDILSSVAVQNLVHPQRVEINNFDTLHAAWEEVFNVELLNKRFYRELANWYFWALPQVEFPTDIAGDDEKLRATSVIRLITRLVFCWFLKEKGLVPERLFNSAELENILVDLEPDSSSYYQGILQNLFFATLNQRMGKDKKGKSYRGFALDEGFPKNRATYGVDTLYRYEEHFREGEVALSHFADVPFLNGGLFECLDRTEDGTNRKLYVDGFSRNPKKRPTVPNRLFFAGEQTVDLSDAYGEPKRRNEKVRGLLHILHAYKFTIVENTPIDQEIALDPELLGKVFENLLASYNEETQTTARKQTGSFYTPRAIVDYMVEEALRAHLSSALRKAGMRAEDAHTGLEILFAYTERDQPFNEDEVGTLLDAIHTARILDPACGSGAFPMGVLQKLVHIIHKLDPDNARWKQLQINAAGSIPDSSARDAAIAAIERDFAENEDDYGRKLYLIENCLYGVDIQPIAIQISKLRFFISLLCDQRTNRSKKENHGIRPLPNLETKFVAADTLSGLPEMEQSVLVHPRVPEIESEIETLYHSHFSIQRRDQKLALQRKLKGLRQELANLLAEGLMSPAKSKHVAEWDPFDPQSWSDFFDPHWMFGRALADGFDLILGNPPYISVERFAGTATQRRLKASYKTYAARGDIYCFFYERGAHLLRDGGTLVFITSNKWMRAGYGKKLRDFLATEVDTQSVLDFGMAQNFGAATTYTCVTRFSKGAPSGSVMSCYASDDLAVLADPAAYFAANATAQAGVSEEPWVVLSKPRERIKALVEPQGTPLERWDVEINYGVKTGLNQAFYVTEEQRDAFIAEDPSCEAILVPLLRGRQIARYETAWDGTWMINAHNGLRASGVPRIDVKADYPTLFRHLSRWKEGLARRVDMGAHWSNLRNCAYLREFNRPKIMYPNMTKFLPFYFDDAGRYFTNDKGFIVTSDSAPLCYIVAFLNSHLFRCCFRDNFPELMGNTYEVRKIFVDKIPLREPAPMEAAVFDKLVPMIQFAKGDGEAAAAQFLESLIDACVMEGYFREHMADRDLLMLDDLGPHLTGFDAEASAANQRDFLASFHRTLNAPDSKIRNRLLRLSADSPDLLAVVKEEGRV
jgi:adenine-specific DNA-methyltransferase